MPAPTWSCGKGPKRLRAKPKEAGTQPPQSLATMQPEALAAMIRRNRPNDFLEVAKLIALI